VEKQVTLYTRGRCPLCEKAKQILLELQKEIPFQFIEHDIEEKDEWTEEYGLMIPVVFVGDKMVDYGQIVKEIVRSSLIEDISISN